jgi:hypothetical protein
MKIKRNQLLLVFILVAIIGWLFYTRRYSTYNVEAKDAIIEHVKNTDTSKEDLDHVLIIQLINDYTGDENIIRKVGELADVSDKEALLEYIKKI